MEDPSKKYHIHMYSGDQNNKDFKNAIASLYGCYEEGSLSYAFDYLIGEKEKR